MRQRAAVGSSEVLVKWTGSYVCNLNILANPVSLARLIITLT